MKTCSVCLEKRERLAAKTRERVCSCSSRPGIHLGGTLSAIEVLVALVDFNCASCGSAEAFPGLDFELSLSKGHASLAIAAINDILTGSDFVSSFGENGGIGVQVSPTWSDLPPSGSLGNHLGIALGKAFADALITSRPRRQIVIAGDSELDSGSFLESLASAEKLRVKNITLLIDANGFAVLESVDPQMLRDRVEGVVRESWHVDFVDGHDLDDLRWTLERSMNFDRSIVIAKTVKGKGFGPLENQARSHHGVYSAESSQ